MSVYKNHLTESQKNRILERDCYICAYCDGNANCVDHVIPWAYSHCDDDDNLVASCTECNLMVSDKVFKSFSEKRIFIKQRRKNGKWKGRIAAKERVCSECGKPFDEGHKDASHFICKDCYKVGNLQWEGKSIKNETHSYYLRNKKTQRQHNY